jgi:hypothetical protein
MRSARRLLLAISAWLAIAAGPVTAANAALPPIGIVQGGQANAPSLCNQGNAPSGVGNAGDAANQVCGVATAYVGGTLGQLIHTVGPTVAGSAVVAPVTVSGGPVAVTW